MIKMTDLHFCSTCGGPVWGNQEHTCLPRWEVMPLSGFSQHKNDPRYWTSVYAREPAWAAEEYRRKVDLIKVELVEYTIVVVRAYKPNAELYFFEVSGELVRQYTTDTTRMEGHSHRHLEALKLAKST